MKRHGAIKVSAARKAFMAFDYVLFTIIIILCLYPLWYVFIQSLSGEIVAGQGIILPYKFTFKNYVQVMQLKGLGNAFKISAARTVIG